MANEGIFGTTAQLAYGAGTTDSFAKKQLQAQILSQMQQKQAIDMLQKFGLLNPQGQIDQEKASKLGMSYDTGTGVAFKPGSGIIDALTAAGIYKNASAVAPEGTVPKINPKGSVSFSQDTSLKAEKESEQIIKKIMDSKPGDVDYETAKDLAYGRQTIQQIDKYIGGFGQTSRYAAKALFQKAKQINPTFNEAVVENRQAQLKSGVTSLAKQQALAGQMAKRVDKLGDIVLEYSGKVNRTNYPIMNNIDYLWNTNVDQDPAIAPEIKGLISSIKIFCTDWARSTTGQTGGAAVTDAAREHFEDMIKATDNPEVIKKQVGLAKRDTQATLGGYSDMQKELMEAYQMEFGGGGVLQATGLAPSGSSAPKAGVTENGYKFKGGDPSDPKSWEKI